MKTATIRECRSKVSAISKELTTIGSGAAALEGVEQELAGAVSCSLGVVWCLVLRVVHVASWGMAC